MYNVKPEKSAVEMLVNIAMLMYFAEGQKDGILISKLVDVRSTVFDRYIIG